jgi:predicted pyridoxine 5'-phosphate oxidase superfamily flavin-nucleotide-binding protein
MVKQEIVKSAVSLGQKLKHIFVATADADGLPHVAAAGRISMADDGLITVAAWFCPGTVMNIGQNPKVSLVLWDAVADTGHQLLGKVEKVEDSAMLNGYVPELEGKDPSPQVERRLLVRVEKVIAFSHAPHSDLEG